MGNIYRKIDICGLTEDGTKLGCEHEVDVLIDNGSTTTVISRRLARRIRGRMLGMPTRIEGRQVPLKLTGIELHEDGCEIVPVVVAVDDDLTARAGETPDGMTVHVILGQDYLQKQRVAVRHGEREDQVVCNAAPLRSLGDGEE